MPSAAKPYTYDKRTNQYYHHLFLSEQPDLNWLRPRVRDSFEEILRFWFDRGVAGFRIDVVHELVKDPPSQANRAEIHNVLRRWRQIANGYEPARLLLGETWVMDLDELATFYGRTDELQLAFNFPFMFAGLEAAALENVVKGTEDVLPSGAVPVWALSNHDAVRFPTRICDEDDAQARCALLALFTLRGTVVLYDGDELGMRQVEGPIRSCARRTRSGRRADAHAVGRCRVARSVAPARGRRGRASQSSEPNQSRCSPSVARRSLCDAVASIYAPAVIRRLRARPESGRGSAEAARRSL